MNPQKVFLILPGGLHYNCSTTYCSSTSSSHCLKCLNPAWLPGYCSKRETSRSGLLQLQHWPTSGGSWGGEPTLAAGPKDLPKTTY